MDGMTDRQGGPPPGRGPPSHHWQSDGSPRSRPGSIPPPGAFESDMMNFQRGQGGRMGGPPGGPGRGIGEKARWGPGPPPSTRYPDDPNFGFWPEAKRPRRWADPFGPRRPAEWGPPPSRLPPDFHPNIIQTPPPEPGMPIRRPDEPYDRIYKNFQDHQRDFGPPHREERHVFPGGGFKSRPGSGGGPWQDGGENGGQDGSMSGHSRRGGGSAVVENLEASRELPEGDGNEREGSEEGWGMQMPPDEPVVLDGAESDARKELVKQRVWQQMQGASFSSSLATKELCEKYDKIMEKEERHSPEAVLDASDLYFGAYLQDDNGTFFPLHKIVKENEAMRNSIINMINLKHKSRVATECCFETSRSTFQLTKEQAKILRQCWSGQRGAEETGKNM